MKSKLFGIFFVIGGLLSMIGIVTVVQANHSWGGYHWTRGENPAVLALADNVSPAWDGYLATASSDWSASSTLLATNVIFGGKDPRKCRPTLGRIDVCDASYGNNGWLGIAQIWVNGTHITQGTVKMNDTYFKTATYNTPAWKNLVMCQEVGHTFGLNHQDEIFNNPNLGTCMDYTNDPSGLILSQLNNQHPNFHDYEELGIIYAHQDGVIPASTIPASNRNNIDMGDAHEWGKVIQREHNGKSSIHERDLGKGEKVFTFVVWAE